MRGLKIYAIDVTGLEFDVEIEYDPAKDTLETIRQQIADQRLLSKTPEAVQLIKRGKNQDGEDEKEIEDLQQTLSEFLDEGNVLGYVLEHFAGEVKIKLLVEPNVIQWIAESSKEFHFLVGNSTGYKVTYKQIFWQHKSYFYISFWFKAFPIDEREAMFEVRKKSWWRLPTKSKVAIGYKFGEGYVATQFVVKNGDDLELRVEKQELELWINAEKKMGEKKRYEESKTGEYILEVIRALPGPHIHVG